MKVTYENTPCVNCHETEDTHVEGKCLFGTTRYRKIANHRMHNFVMMGRRGLENQQKKQAAMLRVQPKDLSLHRVQCVWEGPVNADYVLGRCIFFSYDADGKEFAHAGIGNWIRVSSLAGVTR